MHQGLKTDWRRRGSAEELLQSGLTDASTEGVGQPTTNADLDSPNTRLKQYLESDLGPAARH